MVHKLQLRKEGFYLYFTRDDQKSVRYNLKDKVLENYYNNKWQITKQQYEFFKNYHVGDIVTTDTKFLDLIDLVKKTNPNCRSLSTFLVRLDKYLIYEPYILEGVLFETDIYSHHYHLKRELREYDKNTIKVLQECKFTVRNRFENSYFNYPELYKKVFNVLYLLDFEPERKLELLEAVTERTDEFRNLIDRYLYDTKSLLKYLMGYTRPFENIPVREAIRLLDDYYRMANQIGRNIKKYPKYLKSIHDIITANYNAYKREYDEIMFIRNQKPELEYKDNTYCVSIPSSSKDIISEGTSLNHCVASYVNSIIAGKVLIIFLRRMESPNTSLVTLEYKDNKIVQAKGAYNRSLEKEEYSFLCKYAKEKRIELTVGENL